MRASGWGRAGKAREKATAAKPAGQNSSTDPLVSGTSISPAIQQGLEFPDLVAAVGFREVEGAVRFLQDRRGEALVFDPAETDADRDMHGLGKNVVGHVAAQPLQDGHDLAPAHVPQQDDEFLAAIAVAPVSVPEGPTQNVGEGQQHFVADQVAEGVVDGLEMIDIQHRQVVPVQVVIAAPSLLPGGQRFMQMLFQPPAVHQAGQDVLFAVVEQPDEVLVDPQHALDHAQLALGSRPSCPAPEPGGHRLPWLRWA
jgi:hypothetical protein